MLENAIRHRAYELYLHRGKAYSHDVDDWLQAEAELVHVHSTTVSYFNPTTPQRPSDVAPFWLFNLFHAAN
jgi:hypothetical protein